MPVCQFCDHRNDDARRNCEKCGAELPVDPTTIAAREARRELEGLDADVVEILEREGKIAAIKHYRDETGCGLREAKEAVEQLAARVGISPRSGAGCAALFVALFATLCLAAVGFVAGAGRWPW